MTGEGENGRKKTGDISACLVVPFGQLAIWKLELFAGLEKPKTWAGTSGNDLKVVQSAP